MELPTYLVLLGSGVVVTFWNPVFYKQRFRCGEFLPSALIIMIIIIIIKIIIIIIIIIMEFI